MIGVHTVGLVRMYTRTRLTQLAVTSLLLAGTSVGYIALGWSRKDTLRLFLGESGETNRKAVSALPVTGGDTQRCRLAFGSCPSSPCSSMGTSSSKERFRKMLPHGRGPLQTFKTVGGLVGACVGLDEGSSRSTMALNPTEWLFRTKDGAPGSPNRISDPLRTR